MLEGRLRRSAIKELQVIDQLFYAYVVPDLTKKGRHTATAVDCIAGAFFD
jgi:hypothetical protein